MDTGNSFDNQVSEAQDRAIENLLKTKFMTITFDSLPLTFSDFIDAWINGTQIPATIGKRNVWLNIIRLHKEEEFFYLDVRFGRHGFACITLSIDLEKRKKSIPDIRDSSARQGHFLERRRALYKAIDDATEKMECDHTPTHRS